MKNKYFYIATMFLVLCLVLTACEPGEPEPSETTPDSDKETSASPSEETSYAGLGLTEEEIRMLEESGVANVESAEVASKIAGFEVFVPAYVPDGFIPGKYMINISGAGLPAEMSPKFNNTKVTQTFTYQEDRNIMVVLTQSPQPFGIGGSEPEEICGQTGERAFTKADSANGQPNDTVTLGWEKNGIYYSLTGILGETLDEAELEKMACSIINNN